MDDPTDHDQDRAFGDGPAGDLRQRTPLDGEFVSQVESLVSEEPRTVTEVHQSLGEPQGLSRSQTEYRLDRISSTGTIQSKKSPGRTGPQIFWVGDSE